MFLTRFLQSARARKSVVTRTAAILTAVALTFGVSVAGAGTATAASTPNAVLSIEKSTIATVVAPGDYFVYEMKIGCESLETICINAAMHDSIPADLRVVSNTSEPAVRVIGTNQNADVTVGTYDATTGTSIDISFNETSPRFPGIEGIEDGQKLSVLVSVQLPTSTPLSKDGAKVTNTASASADNATTVSDSADVTLSVPPTPAVDVTKSWANQGSIVADAAATNDLALGIRNTSNIAATTLTLVDPKAGTTNPFTSVAFTGFGNFTMPQGAATVTVTATTGTGTVTGSAAATPALSLPSTAVTYADVTGFTFTFDSASGSQIVSNGTAASIVLHTVQRSSVSMTTSTIVANTDFGTVTTPRGVATRDANSSFTIIPPTATVTAYKAFDSGPSTSPILAGTSSSAYVKGTNTSNTPLSSLTITEPASTITNPFPASLTFVGFGKTGNGNTTTNGNWPTGATGATVTVTYDSGSPTVASVTALTSWPTPDPARKVTGFTVKYTGSIAINAYAQVPFYVTTATTASGQVLNRVQVDGNGPAGDALPATYDASIYVAQPAITSTTTKTLTAKGNNTAGQEILATLTGKVTAANVPVRQIVIDDTSAVTTTNAPGAKNMWTAFTATKVTSTVVPSNATLTIKTTDGTTWTTLGTYAANSTVTVALPVNVGVRFIWDADLTSSFALNTTVTAKMIFSLNAAQAANSLTWSNCATTAIAGDSSTTGTSFGCTTTTLQTGVGSTPILTQQTAKSWSPTQLLIPTDTANGVYPASNLTFSTTNNSAINATNMSLRDATNGTTPFEYVDVTKVTVTEPAGADTTKTRIQLLRKDGTTVFDTTGSTAVADAKALASTALVDVYDIRVSVQGTFAPSAVLTVVAATQLRKTARTSGDSITTAAAAVSGTVNNTVTSSVSNATDTVPGSASAALTILPAASAPLDAQLSKTFTPTSDTVFSSNPNRTEKMALGVAKTSGSPTIYVLTDTSPTFWNAFDFVGLSSITGTTSTTGNYKVQIDYLKSQVFSTSVTGALVASGGTWVNGTQFVMPSGTTALTSTQKALPSGITADQVTGIRITYTAMPGSTWGTSTINNFKGQQAIFDIAPRHYLRSGQATSDAASTKANPSEAVIGAVTNALDGTVDDGLRPAPKSLTEVPATFTFTAGNQAITVTKTPKTSAVVPGEEIPFKLTVSNTGTKPLVNPVFTDVIPWDAKGALLQYNPVMYTAASFAATPNTAAITVDSKKITVTTNNVVTAGVTTTQVAFSFPAGSSILPGESYTITLPMKVRAGVERNTIFNNTFVETADGGFRATDIAQVTVLEGGSYGRIKDVKENVAAGGTPTGLYHTIDKSNSCITDGGFYRVPCLVETKPDSTETWRLRVINTGNLPTNSMTMVDVFPSTGDTGTSKSLSGLSRGSQWTPTFTGGLTFGTLPAGSVTTVSYQTAAQAKCVLNGDPNSSTPFGTTCAASQWLSTNATLSNIADLSKVTAIKVQFDFPTTKLQPGDMVTATYQTQTPTRASSTPAYATGGTPTPAWNSFVVFTTTDKTGGPDYETLEPNKAGIAYATPVAVGDFVWVDVNRNGKQDAGEPGLEGVTVKLFDTSNALVATTTTDADGHYLFDNLYPADYHVSFTLTSAQQDKFRFTVEGAGTNVAVDANADKSTGFTDTFHLDVADAAYPTIMSAADYKTMSGTQIGALFIDPTIDAGVIPNSVSVGDYVWLDTNGDGVQGTTESGIEGVTLYLTGPDGKSVTGTNGSTVSPTTTDADGFYEFTGLPVLAAGEKYTVHIDYVASALPLFGLFKTKINGTTDKGLDSSRDTSASITDLTVDGDSDYTLDFGFTDVDLTTFALPEDPTTLAFTGAVVMPTLILFGGLLTGGFMLVLLGRRKRTPKHL